MIEIAKTAGLFCASCVILWVSYHAILVILDLVWYVIRELID